jgi:hypothetical protein
MNAKKILLSVTLVVYGFVCVLLYMNSHWYSVAVSKEDEQEKIQILNRANRCFAFNDTVFYELGKSHLELGIRSLTDRAKSEENLQKSISSLIKSIQLNPASQFSHYLLGRAIIYMNTFSSSFNIDPFSEYKKAALLVDRNTQIFFEVGKTYLSSWHDLSAEDKEFSLELLKDIMDGSDPQKIQNIMHVWEMSVEDYDIVERILPDDPRIIRLIADFLGERSLSLEKRHELLAKAEFIEFERAKLNFQLGENDFFYYRLDAAAERFSACIRILDRIKFYQHLSDQMLFDDIEYVQLKKNCYMNLIKCKLESGQGLGEIEKLLNDYLILEDRVADVARFESYLVDRGYISGALGERFDDLSHLYIQLAISFKQSRYVEIMRVGRLFRQSLVVVPEAERERLVAILQIFGDAFQRADYNYDAEQYYKTAIENDPQNLLALLKLRSNYERLNDSQEVTQLTQTIESLLSPKNIELKRDIITKGRRPSCNLLLDGRRIVVEIALKDELSGISPILGVFMNGRIVWEDYVEEKVLSLPLETKIGENIIQIYAVNKDITIDVFQYRFAD